MTSASMQDKTVRELQELARQGTPSPKPFLAQRLSRAARLHLIDILSRWSGPGLALIAGVSIYLAVVAGRAYPARAAAWTLMILAALWTCRRLRTQFRSGSALSARPFKWRASYTSCLSVLGVILASAPILLAPQEASFSFSVQIFALAILASFAGGLFHVAHLPSTLALAVPGAGFAVLTALRSGESGLLVAAGCTAVLGLCGLLLANRTLAQSAIKRYPRTRFLRREVETSTPVEQVARDALQA